ncbi:hypothetical protein JXO52_08915 [bacterium]|nr:hypothetical protein [bacterium]
MKKITTAIAVMLIALFVTSSAFGQADIMNKTYVGGSLGIWYGLGFSANFEKIFNEIEDLGVIGFGAEVGYASRKVGYSWFGGDYGWKYTYIPIFVFGSFHYKLNNPKLDPYARLGLGYVIVSASEYGDYTGTWGTATDSYVSFSGQAGIRYLVSPGIWLRAAVGTPWIASIGADMTL